MHFLLRSTAALTGLMLLVCSNMVDGHVGVELVARRVEIGTQC